MELDKVLCIVVLCAIYEGASKDVVGGRCIQNGLNGFCAPYAACQAAQVAYTVGGKVTFCHVPGKRNIVCCFDRLFSLIPLSGTIYDLVNFYGSVIPTNISRPSIIPAKPAVSTSTTRNWVQTARPWQPTTNTRRPWWYTTSTSTTTTTTTTARPVATTQRPKPTTTEYMPPEYDYVSIRPLNDGCAEINPKLTAHKNGSRAWDMCVEYQQQLVYPCQRSVALLGNMVRVDNCPRARRGSRDAVASPEEFKHMVVLAVGTPQERRQWACTGTLISDRFILSSAHCWANRSQTEERYAILGLLERLTGNSDAYQEHRIESIIYRQSPKDQYDYHDIALLKTATPVRLNLWVVPACLDISGGEHYEAVATRWRRRSWDITNRIQKGFLHKLTPDQYQNWLHSTKNSKRKYKVAAQMGYGSYGYSNDNCEYDNEGPLTVEHPQINCMHTVVGVSSEVGATCGPSPTGSYTRVSTYVRWIEDIVWPDDSNVIFRSK